MKRVLIALLFAGAFLSCKSKATPSEESTTVDAAPSADFILDPANTYAFITGVLTWQDPNMSPFSNLNRKDEELYNLLISKGVKGDNIVYLQDAEATNSTMKETLKDLLQRAPANSTFLFYYAGHGARNGNGPMSFANYDYGADNAFGASILTSEVTSLFKGKQVLLLADCCFSGALMEEGKKMSNNGKNVIVFTSSSGSNVSTGNWTFSQTIIDCLSGSGICDRDSDGKITLGEVKNELFDAMKYREKQLSGTAFFNVAETGSFNLSAVQTVAGKPAKAEYIYIRQNDNFQPARVLKYAGNNVTGELYHYSDKIPVTVGLNVTKPIAFADYPVGKQVQVEWKGTKYPAVIKESRDGFHLIHYTGYDDSWNEWVMYERIFTDDKKPCSIEWAGQWYPGQVLQEKDGKYFVQYDGFKRDWDEWVGKERIKF